MVLDWQHENHNIKERNLHLLQTGKWSDCRFLVGETQSAQKNFVGHKLILAMASPVFERMFYGAMPEKEDPIVIPDVQPDAFRAMLQYIYSDCINIGSFDKACELYCVANKYMLPDVVDECSKYMVANLSPNNACRAYEFARLYDELCLMDRSMKLIGYHTREVLAHPSFTDIEVSTLLDILDQKKLEIDSELDLFNALLRFSNIRGMFKKESLQNSGQQHSEQNSSVAAGDMRHVEEIKIKSVINGMMQGLDERLIKDETILKKAVKKIRFLTMTPEQFAKGPARSKLLEQHEAFAIIIKLCCPRSTDRPMPEGFCSSTSSRSIRTKKIITSGSRKRKSYCTDSETSSDSSSEPSSEWNLKY